MTTSGSSFTTTPPQGTVARWGYRVAVLRGGAIDLGGGPVLVRAGMSGAAEVEATGPSAAPFRDASSAKRASTGSMSGVAATDTVGCEGSGFV